MLRLFPLLLLSPPFHATVSKSVTDSVTITDSVTRTLILTRSISSSPTITAAIVSVHEIGPHLTSTLTIVDSIVAHKIVTATFSDSITISTSAVRVQPASVSHTVNIIGTIAPLNLSEVETLLCLHDSVLVQKILNRTILDIFPLKDYALGIISNRIVADDFGLSRRKMQFKGVASQALNQNLSITDKINVPIDSQGDSLTITDAIDVEIERCLS